MLYISSELFPVAAKHISIDLFSCVSELANCSLYSSTMYVHNSIENLYKRDSLNYL